MKKYDLIIIGAGPAGEKAATEAAYFGHKVALIEKEKVIGGAMINTGTLPSKTLRETSLFLDLYKHRNLFGIKLSIDDNITVKKFMYREKQVVETEHKILMDNIIYNNIELYQGFGYIEDANTVKITKNNNEIEYIKGDYIIIAVGSHPYHPPDINFDNEHIYDSDTILQLDKFPSSLAILGGGVIGCEYACIFSLLGIKTYLIDKRSTILPFVDNEILTRLMEHMKENNVSFLLNSDTLPPKINNANTVNIEFSDGSILNVEKVLFSGGRTGSSKNLGLENLGIEIDKRGNIIVNQHYQTNIPNIYAVGDVIGFPALASTSMEQGRIAVCHAFNHHYKKQLAPILPYGIYTVPEISMVGITEQQAKEYNIKYEIGKFEYTQNARGIIIGDNSGLVKLIFSAEDQILPPSINIPFLKKLNDGSTSISEQQLLGVHIIGESATELIHIGMACLYYHGTIDYFIQSVFNFPTLSESFKYAAYDGFFKLQQK